MIENMKKVELHLHLDGSVRVETLAEISHLSIEYVRSLATVEKECESLDAYLKKFDLPISCMQTIENLTRISRELVEDLERENVIYAEIRFCPLFHIRQGLLPDEVVEAVLTGLSFGNIRTQLILCMMRGFSYEENKQILELARKYYHHGVCAIDLAGAEAFYPNELYTSLFEEARDFKIPYTIHAGEAAGKGSILSAIHMKAQRIGHGTHIENDPDVIRFLKNENILLEICLTSNLQTNSIEKLEDHPILSYFKQGMPLSINTDNRTVSGITLTSELHLLQDLFGFSNQDLLSFQKMALEHAFLPPFEKQELQKKLQS